VENNNKLTINIVSIIIIVIVCIVALIAGIVCFFIFNKSHLEPQVGNLLSNANQLSNNNQNNYLDDTYINEPNNSTNDNSNNNILSDNNSVVAQISTKSTPLPLGTWGLASKYSSNKYVDIPVQITNIERGQSAKQKVKDYCNSNSSIYKYEDAKSGMEWAIIEYNVDLTNVESYSMGKPIKVDSKIIGTDGSNSIKYNNKIYTVSTMSMSNDYSRNNLATGYFAVQLPIGCTEYTIVLGSASHTQAFFAGK